MTPQLQMSLRSGTYSWPVGRIFHPDRPNSVNLHKRYAEMKVTLKNKTQRKSKLAIFGSVRECQTLACLIHVLNGSDGAARNCAGNLRSSRERRSTENRKPCGAFPYTWAPERPCTKLNPPEFHRNARESRRKTKIENANYICAHKSTRPRRHSRRAVPSNFHALV